MECKSALVLELKVRVKCYIHAVNLLTLSSVNNAPIKSFGNREEEKEEEERRQSSSFLKFVTRLLPFWILNGVVLQKK